MEKPSIHDAVLNAGFIFVAGASVAVLTGKCLATNQERIDSAQQVALAETLDKTGINETKKNIGNSSLEIRRQFSTCIEKALSDCSQGLKETVTAGLVEPNQPTHQLTNGDLQCIRDKKRKAALVACTEIVTKP